MKLNLLDSVRECLSEFSLGGVRRTGRRAVCTEGAVRVVVNIAVGRTGRRTVCTEWTVRIMRGGFKVLWVEYFFVHSLI